MILAGGFTAALLTGGVAARSADRDVDVRSDTNHPVRLVRHSARFQLMGRGAIRAFDNTSTPSVKRDDAGKAIQNPNKDLPH